MLPTAGEESLEQGLQWTWRRQLIFLAPAGVHVRSCSVGASFRNVIHQVPNRANYSPCAVGSR
jgi:hypothetical protein